MEKLPTDLHDDPDYKLLQTSLGQKHQITIAHLINRRYAHSANSKDYEFSRTTVRQLWQDGLEDVRRAVAIATGSRRRKSPTACGYSTCRADPSDHRTKGPA